MRSLLIVAMLALTVAGCGLGTGTYEVEPTTSTPSHALRFDGENDWVSVFDSDHFRMGPSDFTVECWIRTSRQGDNQRIIGKGRESHIDYEGRWSISLHEENGIEATFEDANDGSRDALVVRGTRVVTDGQWHHISVVFDRGRSLRIHVDGAEDVQDTTLKMYTGELTNQINSPILVGSTQDSEMFFQGDITDIRIWEKALTVEEIFLYKHQLVNISERGLLASWRMTEGEGQEMVEYVTGYNGILGNGPETDVGDPVWITIIHP